LHGTSNGPRSALPEPDLNSLSHRLIDAAVLEFGPTEIFPPVGAPHRAIPVSADRGALSGPHTGAKSRLLAVGGQNPARRGLSAGGDGIRTISPAPAKGSSVRCQSETAARKAEPLTGLGPRQQCLPGVAPHRFSLRGGPASSLLTASSSGESGEIDGSATFAARGRRGVPPPGRI
jgi:hypothetical protein